MHRFLLALLLALPLSSCDFSAAEGAFDDFNVILGIEAQSTVVGGLVVDAATGDVVEGAIAISYGSDTPGAIVDGFGEHVAAETIEGGAFNFAIAEEHRPTAARPVEVEVRVEAPGYLPQRRVLALADSGAYDLSVRMLAPDRPAEGAETAAGAAQASSSEGTAAPIAAAAGAAAVDVPQGTVLSDAQGQRLAGPAEVRLTAIDPSGPALDALPALPEGDVAVAALSLSATVGGVPVASAGGAGAEVTVALPAVDPATGQAFVAGDVIDVFAYDPASGTWTAIGEAAVVAGSTTARSAGGGLTARFSVTLFGRSITFSRRGVPTVEVAVAVDRNGREGALGAYALGDGFGAFGTITASSSQVSMLIPANAARERTGVQFGGRSYDAADAGCTVCRVSLPAPAPEVSLVVRPECPTPDQRVYINNVPTFTASAREAGTPEWFSVGRASEITRRQDGSLESIRFTTADLVAGTTYDARGSYLGESYRDTFTIPASGTMEASFEAPSGLCR